MNHIIPLFFKLWFAFVAVTALFIFGLSVATLGYIATNPSALGEYAREVISGLEGGKE